jgi:hypothetical protein
MMDLPELAAGLAVFKSGMEGIRSAFQVFRDIKGTLPADKAAEVGKALERSEEQFAIAEAQIAKGLGYAMCHCAFPPTPMLTVGWITKNSAGSVVHRCPKCGVTDNRGIGWAPTKAISALADATLAPTP